MPDRHRLAYRAAARGICLIAIALIVSGEVTPPKSVPLPIPKPSLTQPQQRQGNARNPTVAAPAQLNAASVDQTTVENAGEPQINWPAWIEAGSAIITALFAVVLALAIFRLWASTRGLHEEMHGSRPTIRISIAAAKQSAEAVEKALTILERPILFVEKIKFDPRSARPLASVIVHNYGRTPANVEKFKASLRVLDHVPTAADEPTTDDSPIDVIIGQGDSWESPSAECADKLTPQRYAAIDGGLVHFYVWGEVHYRDLFGNDHPTVFLRRLDRRHGQWEPIGGVERNYGE